MAGFEAVGFARYIQGLHARGVLAVWVLVEPCPAQQSPLAPSRDVPDGARAVLVIVQRRRGLAGPCVQLLVETLFRVRLTDPLKGHFERHGRMVRLHNRRRRVDCSGHSHSLMAAMVSVAS